jgi:hypothetical protein
MALRGCYRDIRCDRRCLDGRAGPLIRARFVGVCRGGGRHPYLGRSRRYRPGPIRCGWSPSRCMAM